MCEIFPEVSKCCLCISLRLGMLFISVLAIMTGVFLLCLVEQRTNANFDSVQNVTKINQPDKILSSFAIIIPAGLAGMSVVFMFTGIVLLFATLSDQEGLVQVFVWMMFLNVLLGFVLVFMVGFECMFMSACMLQGLDWLSASGLLVMVVAYLFLWLYFIVVANSYVLNVFV